VLYVISTVTIVYLIKFQTPIKDTYDKSLDTFPHWELAVVPTLVITNIMYLQDIYLEYFDPVELMWMFSIILESIAMVPQLFLFYKYREIARSIAISIAFRGTYRLLYIFNWIFRAYTEPFYRHHWLVYFCGILQTILYIDFFGYCIQR
jgi:ER lumen protein retaining receptor